MDIKLTHGLLLPGKGLGLSSALVSLSLAPLGKTNWGEEVGRIEKSGVDEEVTRGKHCRQLSLGKGALEETRGRRLLQGGAQCCVIRRAGSG